MGEVGMRVCERFVKGWGHAATVGRVRLGPTRQGVKYVGGHNALRDKIHMLRCNFIQSDC